jgi:hypothetical protein
VEVTGHQDPGIDHQTLVLDKVVQCIDNDLFVGWPDKYIDLINRIQRKKITGVKRNDRFITGQHGHFILMTKST